MLRRLISYGLCVAVVAFIAFSIGPFRVAQCPNTTNLTYQEIRTHIESITKTPEHPDGPEVNDDGIVDPKIREALGAYSDCVVGKSAQNWQGWLDGDFTHTDHGYNVGIHMKILEPSVTAQAEVIIQGASEADVAEMRVWYRNQQRVTFSGVLDGTQSSGRVFLTDVTMKPPP